MWQVWRALENRWLMAGGLSGERRQGLDMTQAESVMRLMGMRRRERERVFVGLCVMEDAALETINA